MTTPVWIKPVLIGAAGGAVALAIFGFSVAGWVTKSDAEKMADLRGRDAAASAQVPYCVSASKMDPNAAAVLLKLKDASSYQRDTIVADSGWATAPGANQANRLLAGKCAETLMTTAMAQ